MVDGWRSKCAMEGSENVGGGELHVWGLEDFHHGRNEVGTGSVEETFVKELMMEEEVVRERRDGAHEMGWAMKN